MHDTGAPVDLTLLQRLPAGSKFSGAQTDGRRISNAPLEEGMVSIDTHIQPDGKTHIISIAYRGAP
jgi:hypothetical protein